MKKQVFLLAIASLIFITSPLNAQFKHLRSSSDFGLGIKGGLNYSSQSTAGGSPTVDVSNIIRFNGGVYFNYFIFKFLAIQPELMISGKGTHWKDPFFEGDDILTYLDMPILIKYQPVKLLNIHAGPEIGYRLRAIQKYVETGQKTDISDYYNKYDFGVAFGVETNLPFRVNITIRYVLGLKSASTTYDKQWKNNFFQISAGYRILGN